MVILDRKVDDEETHDDDDDGRPTRDYETDDCGCGQDRIESKEAVTPKKIYKTSELISSSDRSCTGVPEIEEQYSTCRNCELLTNKTRNIKLTSASTSNNPHDVKMMEVIRKAQQKDRAQEKPCEHCEYSKDLKISNREKHCCLGGEPSTSTPVMNHYDEQNRSKTWKMPCNQCGSQEKCNKNEKIHNFGDKPTRDLKIQRKADDCFKIIQKTLAQMEARAQGNKFGGDVCNNELCSKLSIVNNCIRNVSLTSVPSSSKIAEPINNMPEDVHRFIRNKIIEKTPRNDLYAEEVTVAVLDWSNKIPIYQGQNGCKLSLKKENIEMLIRNILKLSKHINDSDYEYLVIVSIEKCLEALPLWFPAERRDAVEYKNEIMRDLLEAVNKINNKLLRQKFRECCIHVATEKELMNRFYLKAYHNTKQNKSADRKRVLATTRSIKHKNITPYLEKVKKTNKCKSEYETENMLRAKIYNWFDEVQRIDNNRIRNEVTNIILNHLKPLMNRHNVDSTKRRESVYKLLHTIFKELPITICCKKNKTMDFKTVAQELTDRLVTSQRFINYSTKYVYQTSNASLFEPTEPMPAKKDRILTEVNKYFNELEIEADDESIEAIVSILYTQQNRLFAQEVDTELKEALQNIGISEEIIPEYVKKFTDIVRTLADEPSADVTVSEDIEDEGTNKKYIRCNYGITRNLTDCLQKYLNMYAQSDKFTKDAVTKRMVTEFEKLEYDESSVDDERITTITFQRKLDIVREVSEWLRTIPLETTFNAPTNYNRAVLVTEMAEDIFDVLESFSTDELNDLINLWMPELPVLQTHTEQLDTMRTSLIFRLENLKRSARTRHAIVPEVADGKSDVELFQDFVEPYVVVKQALGDDVATQAAMIHQLAHALKDVRDFQLARRLMKVSERNQSVRRFSMELEFIKHISEWLKHIPTKEIVNEAERKERMTLISNLAEYLGKAKDSNLDHPIPEAEITKHVSIFLDKVLVPTVGKDNYVSYISDLKGHLTRNWHENPATEPQGFPSQSGVPQQDRSAELRKHYIGNDTDYGTFSENVPKSSSQEEMALPLPEEVQLHGSSSKSQSLGSQNSGRNQTLVGQPSGQDPSAPRDENNASNAQRYRPPSFPRDIQQPEHNLSSQNYRPYQSVPIATPKGIHQQEHHNYSERPMPTGYPSYRPPSVRMSPNQFNAPNDSIVPSADFDPYTQNDRQRTNVSEGSARPRTDYGQTPPCTSPCADLYSASNAPRRNDSHISHGPRSIAGSSIGPHTTSLFEDQQKNCIDLLYDVIEEWCQGLPLEEATRQDEIRNSDLKAQMELRLVLQISEINRDDNIFNNPNTYDERLDYIITELLNAVPPNPRLETLKPALKDDLKQSILTLRPEIQKGRDRYRFKEQLRMTVERATQRTFELSSEMRAQMDVICEEIIDDFIEYTYANNKARLKSKAMQTIEKALSHTNSPHEHAKRLFAALSQINAPIYESIYCEIGEIRMKREIAIWLKRIPQIDSNHVQTTIRQKIKSALAKKLYGLESTQTTENNMRPAIFKALKKMGVEQDNDQLVEELLVRLRNSKTQRYQQDPIIVDEVPSYASSFDRNLPQSDPPIIEPRVQSPQNQHQRAASALGLELLQNTLNPGIPLATIPQSSVIGST
ncbi:uncharacterized protein LOC105389914 [Plutella xylostella]|uniref:uncharacterized protein LOC105389914 n=1 Tax=Plutella xylostella TaxID=51655 RepID=UPI002032AE2C|nr:uncharacterized protein LOC105389914 [Plutella xylostella]